jgi:hypothetical protein
MKLFLLFIPLLCFDCITVCFKQNTCDEMKKQKEVKAIKQVKKEKISSYQIIPASLLIQM